MMTICQATAVENQQYHETFRHRVEEILTTEASFVHNPEFEVLSLEDVKSIPSGICVYSEKADPEQGTSRNGLHVYRMQTRPLLSIEGERYLFRKLNFCKYRANVLRATVSSTDSDMDVLHEIESLLILADQTRNHIAECNLRLVNSIVRRFATTENEFEELVSEANTILINVVDKFDYSRGFRFSTYATHSIQRHIYRCCKVKQRRKQREFATDIDQVHNLAEDKRNPQHVPLEMGPQVFSKIDDCLNEREAFVIKARYGLGQTTKMRTLRDIAAEMKLSKERVRQIQVVAIKKLRELFKHIDLEGSAA